MINSHVRDMSKSFWMFLASSVMICYVFAIYVEELVVVFYIYLPMVCISSCFSFLLAPLILLSHLLKLFFMLCDYSFKIRVKEVNGDKEMMT